MKYVLNLEALNGQPWKAGYQNTPYFVTFTTPMAGQAQAGCDIALTYPPLGLTGSEELPGLQTHPFTVNVLVKNIGTAACPGAFVKIFLLPEDRRLATKPFNPLNPGQSQIISILDPTPYRVRKSYAAWATRHPAFNDDRQHNHFDRRVQVRFAEPQ